MEYRIEKDTMGEIEVPKGRYWGAQTQRSFQNFEIGIEKMPRQVIRAFGVLKKAAALTNNKLGKLDDERAQLISQVCDEIIEGSLDDHFPLAVWQTGSGTQSNMNSNEVIANRANEIKGEKIIHPNDHVNMSQSSNDTFPTAMNIAAVAEVEDKLLPAVRSLKETFLKLEKENEGIVKTGRTHLQDAVPLGFSQEISAWTTMMEKNEKYISQSLEDLKELALGGTAVGTGLNAPKGFDEEVARQISKISGKDFKTAGNKFYSLTSRSDLSYSHGALVALATDLLKIANDVRWLASGPRCGIGEISIPANEPGSSIMPGKVNPTQSEALTMVVAQVLGNHTTIAFASSQGNFQLNVFMPVNIYNYLQSAKLLAEAIESFNKNAAQGIRADREVMKYNLDNSLMLVTALNPHIGYDKSAEIANTAHKNGTTLREEAINLGYLSGEDFDKIMKPEEMI